MNAPQHPCFERLARRAGAPLGVVDVQRVQRQVLQRQGWVERRFPLLARLAARAVRGDIDTGCDVPLAPPATGWMAGPGPARDMPGSRLPGPPIGSGGTGPGGTGPGAAGRGATGAGAAGPGFTDAGHAGPVPAVPGAAASPAWQTGVSPPQGVTLRVRRASMTGLTAAEGTVAPAPQEGASALRPLQNVVAARVATAAPLAAVLATASRHPAVGSSPADGAALAARTETAPLRAAPPTTVARLSQATPSTPPRRDPAAAAVSQVHAVPIASRSPAAAAPHESRQLRAVPALRASPSAPWPPVRGPAAAPARLDAAVRLALVVPAAPLARRVESHARLPAATPRPPGFTAPALRIAGSAAEPVERPRAPRPVAPPAAAPPFTTEPAANAASAPAAAHFVPDAAALPGNADLPRLHPRDWERLLERLSRIVLRKLALELERRGLPRWR